MRKNTLMTNSHTTIFHRGPHNYISYFGCTFSRFVEQDLQLWILVSCWRDKKADWRCPVKSWMDSQLEPIASSCILFLWSFATAFALWDSNGFYVQKLEKTKDNSSQRPSWTCCIPKVVGLAAVEQPIVAKVNDLLKNLEDQLRLPCDAYKARGLATELKRMGMDQYNFPEPGGSRMVKQKTLEIPRASSWFCSSGLARPSCPSRLAARALSDASWWCWRCCICCLHLFTCILHGRCTWQPRFIECLHRWPLGQGDCAPDLWTTWESCSEKWSFSLSEPDQNEHSRILWYYDYLMIFVHFFFWTKGKNVAYFKYLQIMNGVWKDKQVRAWIMLPNASNVSIESRASRCSGQDLPRGTSWPGNGVFAPFKLCSLHPSLRRTCLISASLSYYSLAECIVLSGRSLCRGVLRPIWIRMNQTKTQTTQISWKRIIEFHWIVLPRDHPWKRQIAADVLGISFLAKLPGAEVGKSPTCAVFQKIYMFVILCIFLYMCV